MAGSSAETLPDQVPIAASFPTASRSIRHTSAVRPSDTRVHGMQTMLPAGSVHAGCSPLGASPVLHQGRETLPSPLRRARQRVHLVDPPGSPLACRNLSRMQKPVVSATSAVTSPSDFTGDGVVCRLVFLKTDSDRLLALPDGAMRSIPPMDLMSRATSTMGKAVRKATPCCEHTPKSTQLAARVRIRSSTSHPASREAGDRTSATPRVM
mmetsp:Transcript_34926/g.85886  ORF Transcript_34926/g.85886 Transcript_34926/m.85886 type:complete len:210 (+) Transcript_34926:1387-2016(+)